MLLNDNITADPQMRELAAVFEFARTKFVSQTPGQAYNSLYDIIKELQSNPMTSEEWALE